MANPRHRALLAVLLLAALPALASEGGGKAAPPAPKIMDVRVWYYPTAKSKPQLVLWWAQTGEQADPRTGRVDATTRKAKMYRPGTFSRKGIFRVRARIEGAMLAEGRPTNWVSIVFRDSASNLFDLPVALHEGHPEVRPPVRDALDRQLAGEELTPAQKAVIQEFRGPTIKDIYWRVPYNFVNGSFDFQVAVWNDSLPVTSLETGVVDQTDFFILGEMDF